MRPYATALIALLLFGVTARAGQTAQQQPAPATEPQKPAEAPKAA